MVFGEINAGISLWERFSKWWHRRNNPPVESIANRFIRLFETHGVHRNQIPRFIDHGLTLKDVQDDASLLAKLDEQLLEDVCTKFAVRREWLDGAESQIHPCHDFYKYPKKFAEFIEKLMDENPDANLQCVLIAPEKVAHANALLILQETIGAVGDKEIYRFHLCHNWVYSYWKCRAYLTACIALAWKNQIHVHGRYLPKNEIDKLSAGEMLLGWQGSGIWKFNGRHWHPEDMALKPDEFLKDIDPEQDNFGIKAGLSLWLDLAQEGWMNAGLGKNARQLFQQELSKY